MRRPYHGDPGDEHQRILSPHEIKHLVWSNAAKSYRRKERESQTVEEALGWHKRAEQAQRLAVNYRELIKAEESR